jgi:hypothetical protein
MLLVRSRLSALTFSLTNDAGVPYSACRCLSSWDKRSMTCRGMQLFTSRHTCVKVLILVPHTGHHDAAAELPPWLSGSHLQAVQGILELALSTCQILLAQVLTQAVFIQAKLDRAFVVPVMQTKHTN